MARATRPKLSPEEKALAGLRHACVAMVRAYDEALLYQNSPLKRREVVSFRKKQRERTLRAYWRAEKRLELAAAEYVGARLEAMGVLASTLAVLKRKAEARHEYPTRKRRRSVDITATLNDHDIQPKEEN
jgi:hypothetical protein